MARAAPGEREAAAAADGGGGGGGGGEEAQSHECQLCGSPASAPCGSCGAVVYCTAAHQARGASPDSRAPLDARLEARSPMRDPALHWGLEHGEACERMAGQMRRAPELLDLPFTWAPEAAQAVRIGKPTLCAFLDHRGLHGRGLWSALCGCQGPAAAHFWPPGSAAAPGPSGGGVEDWRLSVFKTSRRASTADAPAHQLATWQDYYAWSGLPLDSPAALLLHLPLTVYHALNLSSITTPCTRRELVVVHLIGADKELQALDVFTELLLLLPIDCLQIHCVGPAVPSSCALSSVGRVPRLRHMGLKLELKLPPFFLHDDIIGRHARRCYLPRDSMSPLAEASRQHEELIEPAATPHKRGICTPLLELTFHKGLYHDIVATALKAYLLYQFETHQQHTYSYMKMDSCPDLVLAPDAGLAAYTTWQPTLKLLSSAGCAAVFTDYCEEAALLAARAMAAAAPLIKPSIQVQVNPFRCPYPQLSSGFLLPAFSNAFIFGWSETSAPQRRIAGCLGT
eukprot:SM000093S24412  [mRNA]  locus=s93:122051:125489:- [translate_table: standard]